MPRIQLKLQSRSDTPVGGRCRTVRSCGVERTGPADDCREPIIQRRLDRYPCSSSDQGDADKTDHAYPRFPFRKPKETNWTP
jgi:hypothetical protein